MRPVRVLHLAANRWWTGSADPVIRLVSGLRARGHQAWLAIIAGDRFEQKARAAGLDLVPGLALEVRRAPIALVRDLVGLRAFLRSEAVEIVHANHSHDHWLAALARGGAGLVRTFHNVRAVRHGLPSLWLYRATDAAIAVSAEVAGALETAAGLSAERIWPIRGAADLDRFGTDGDPRVIRDELELGTAPVVGTVARLAPNRGHEMLLRGFRLLLRRVPTARLLLVGKGEARPQLEATVAELDLGRSVVFAGYRDGDLRDVLAALDCFALMGAGSDESCRAALEAMAAGLPVVARRVGALPETVVHGETGLLLEDDTPESIAAALERIVADGPTARRMGEAGRRRVRDEFSPERHVDAVERVYADVLQRLRAPRP